MKGMCINDECSTELRLNQSYYLFPAKPNHFYVSRFNNVNANFGCYKAERFRVIEEEGWPKEPVRNIPELDREKYYRANLIWRPKGYRDKTLQSYIIKPNNTHCYFWKDVCRHKICGCFPLHWFDKFTPIDIQIDELQEEVDLLERESGQLAFF
ncbi:TPA: hypothetical protein ACGPI4_005400 [Bacillus paranthracis]